MGQINEKYAERPSEYGQDHAFNFRIPFADVTHHLAHPFTHCHDYELKFMNCMEAYGPIKGKELCKFLFQDFMECCWKWKQMRRVQHIRSERTRQFIKGVLGQGPRRDLYDETPAQDVYGPDTFDNFEGNFAYYKP